MFFQKPPNIIVLQISTTKLGANKILNLFSEVSAEGRRATREFLKCLWLKVEIIKDLKSQKYEVNRRNGLGVIGV